VSSEACRDLNAIHALLEQMENRAPLDLTQAKILIVDDAPANIGTLRAPLETAGYQVLIATTGEDALEAVADLVPDLILLEAMMPGLDG